jgi:hypothetical protein
MLTQRQRLDEIARELKQAGKDLPPWVLELYKELPPELGTPWPGIKPVPWEPPEVEHRSWPLPRSEPPEGLGKLEEINEELPLLFSEEWHKAQELRAEMAEVERIGQYGHNPAYKAQQNENMRILGDRGLTVSDFITGEQKQSAILKKIINSPSGTVIHDPKDDSFLVVGIGPDIGSASRNATDQFVRWLGADPNDQTPQFSVLPSPKVGGFSRERSPNLEEPITVPRKLPEEDTLGPEEHWWLERNPVPDPVEIDPIPFTPETLGEYYHEGSEVIKTQGTPWVGTKNGLIMVVRKIPKKIPRIPGDYRSSKTSQNPGVIGVPSDFPYDWPIRKGLMPKKPYEQRMTRAEEDTPPFSDPSPVDSPSGYYADIGSPPAKGLIGDPRSIASMMYTKQAGDEDPKREWVSQALPVPRPEPVPKPVAVQPPGMTAVRASTVGGQPQQIVQKAGMELLKQGGKLTPETQQQNLVNRVQNIGMALRDNIPAAAPATTMAAPVQAPVIPGPAASQPTIGKFGFQHAKKQPFYNLLNLAKGNPGMADFAFNQAKKMWDQFDQEGLIPSSSTFSDHVLRRGVPIKTFTNWAMDRPEYHQAVPALTGRILQT